MKNNIIKYILIISDMLLLMGLYFIARFVISDFVLSIESFLLISFIIILLMHNEQIYNLKYDFWQETYKIFKSLLLSYLIILVLFIIKKEIYFFDFLTIYFMLAMLFIPLSKRVIKYLLFVKMKLKKNVLIIGNEEQSHILKNEFIDNWYLGINPIANNFDTVFIASKDILVEELNKIIDRFIDKKCSIYIIPYITDINFAHSIIIEYFNIRYSAIRIENKLLMKKNIFIKNIFDYIISMLLLLFFLFLHIFIALAIKIDSAGSIFFKQPRVGKNGKIFECFKYRTMYVDSKKILDSYLERNPQEREYYEKYHKYKNDPRVTNIGKFLRKTSLDELPQVINVLKGQMSLIGPRPYMLEEVKKLDKNKDIILKVKPGITGLWQVSGRNNLTFQERITLEKWYIKNWSLWMDFVILIKTIKIVLFRVGAR